MHNTRQILKLVVLTLLTLALLGVGTYFLFQGTNKSQVAVEDGRFEVYERFANRYYSQLQFYKGVCYDMKPAAPAVCEESDEAFRVYERYDDGFYRCTDARGYQGRVATIPAGTLWCQ